MRNLLSNYSAPNKQNPLRMCLKHSCDHLRSLPKEKFDPACHVLSVILAQRFHNHFACTIQDVIDEVSECDYPIPIQAERLCDLSEALSARTKILFLRNSNEPKRSWIVLDIYALLHNVNGKIFAPKGFTENVFKPTSTGILPWSQLSKEFPDLDPSLVVAFLGRLEFCQVISDSEILHLIQGKMPLISPLSCYSGDDADKDSPTSTHSSSSDTASISPFPRRSSDALDRRWTSPIEEPLCDRFDGHLHSPCHYHSDKPISQHLVVSTTGPKIYPLHLNFEEKFLFFPGLISPEQPKSDMWTKGEFEYYSGWCLQCVSDQQFFSLRFLHTLLLRLSFSFALTKSSQGNCQQSDCTLWKNGLRWLNLDGIETIVEIVEDRKAVLLLTRMKEVSTLKGLYLRSAIIQKILDTKKEYCKQIITSESFIDPSHLRARNGYPVINRPVQDLKRYDICLVAEAFCSNSK